MITAGKTF